MRKQDHLDRRVGLERAAIGLDQRRVRGGFGKRDLDHAHAAPCRERLHARLHAVVIEIGVEHRVAGPEAVILEDQRLHRLGRVAGKGDLVEADAHRTRQRRAHRLEVADHASSRIITGVAVHALDDCPERREHRPRHHAPIAMLELDDLARDVIFARNPFPVVDRCRAGDRGGGEGQGSGAEHGPAVDIHAAFLGQMRR